MTTLVQTFDTLKKAVADNFKKLEQNSLFVVETDRDQIWDIYLNAFDEANRQEHNCGCCRSFLRQYGSIVTIQDNQMISVWDNLDLSGEFKTVTDALSTYIHTLSITDVFLTEAKKCGTDKNLDPKRNVIWGHFFLEVPGEYVKKLKDMPTLLAEPRDNKNVLKRSLDELTLAATETALELNAQGSLYRGKEKEHLLDKFVLLQRQYRNIPAEDKDNFCWIASKEAGPILSRIRNDAIGTLLIDLSAGMELEQAVKKWEAVMAPANYKRPNPIVTPRMVEDAKAKLSELGLLESLNRRYANETDIPVFNLIYKDKPEVLTDVFAEISKDALVNPRSLSKVEEIGIEKFLSDVIPTAKSMHVLVENNHLNKFVSLLTAQDPNVPTLFKWNNGFSWSYTGNIADSVKERVKAAGGNVVGELRTSLSWSNFDDLDIHVLEPNGEQIYYGHKTSSRSGGTLDVDMNAGIGRTRTPVENIIWTDKSRMSEGLYQVAVRNFCQRDDKDSGFAVQIECNSETFDFEFRQSPRDGQTQQIAAFEYSKVHGLRFQGEVKSNVLSKDKWNIKTNRWSKVTELLFSPNHWESKIGNRHYFWMLENCRSDEAPRPFYNEFLAPQFEAHRKVFEVLAGKLQVPATDNQLSGIGFSDTQRESLLVKVLGKFDRILKVNF